MTDQIDPLLVLQARAEARALLFRCCEYDDLGAAIMPLLIYAHETELAEDIGDDGVMVVIKAAFGEQWVERPK
jgi:hypothetical protein